MILLKMINQIILGNCLEVLKTIPSYSVDLVLTDPPYNISSDLKITMSNHPNTSNKQERTITYDFGDWDKFDTEELHMDFTKQWMEECYRVLTPQGNFVTFFANWLTGDIKRIWEGFGGRARMKLFFLKSNPKPRLRKVDFMQGVEEMFWGTKAEQGHIFNYELGQQLNYVMSAVFYNNETTGHPTQKPEKVVEWIIDYLSNKNSTVLDPFCGSGTIPFCAYKHGRNYIGIEQDQKYVEISNNRINKLKSHKIQQIQNISQL